MPNRFEQSAPPSIDKIYQNLPVGPFGVSPFIHRNRDAGRIPLWGKAGQRIRRLVHWLRALRNIRFAKASPPAPERACCRSV